MFLFYVLSFFKKGDTIQGGTLFKKGHYLRKYGIRFTPYIFGTLACYLLYLDPLVSCESSRCQLIFLQIHPMIFVGVQEDKVLLYIGGM